MSVALAACACLVVGCSSGARTITKTVPAPSTTAATTHTAPAPEVLLGSSHFVQGGEGWGAKEPSKIYNGGDPSGLVTHIRWTKWGQSVAIGTGLHSIFKPEGGYYRQLVRIMLRAYDIGTCTAGGPRAYRKLGTREPERPGGPLGPWGYWAKNLCSYNASVESESPKAAATTGTSATSTPSAEPQTFSGNGVQSLGRIDVAVPSTLEWSCETCVIFSVTGLAEGAGIAIDSQKHTSGQTAVEPGAYHSVDVQAYGEAGVAGEWTITIRPR
jgi:hypothetical protein